MFTGPLLEMLPTNTAHMDPECIPCLNIAVDLPMFVEGIHRRSIMTPFMEVQGLLSDTFLEVDYPHRHPDQDAIGRALPGLVEAALAGDKRLMAMYLETLARNSKVTLPRAAYEILLLDAIRLPLWCMKSAGMLAVLDEFRGNLKALFSQPPATRAALLLEFQPNLVAELQRKALRSVVALVCLEGPLISAMFAESIASAGRSLDDLRSIRGDYKQIARVYLEGFEAISFGLAFHAAIENAATRGDPQLGRDGKRHSLGRMAGWDAKDREPLASRQLAILLGDLSRRTRNKIGHNAAHYDFRSGQIEFDDGKQISLLELQLALLPLARLSSWLVELCACVSLLAKGQKIPKEIQREPCMHGEWETKFLQRG